MQYLLPFLSGLPGRLEAGCVTETRRRLDWDGDRAVVDGATVRSSGSDSVSEPHELLLG